MTRARPHTDDARRRRRDARPGAGRTGGRRTGRDLTGTPGGEKPHGTSGTRVAGAGDMRAHAYRAGRVRGGVDVTEKHGNCFARPRVHQYSCLVIGSFPAGVGGAVNQTRPRRAPLRAHGRTDTRAGRPTLARVGLRGAARVFTSPSPSSLPCRRRRRAGGGALCAADAATPFHGPDGRLKILRRPRPPFFYVSLRLSGERVSRPHPASAPLRPAPPCTGHPSSRVSTSLMSVRRARVRSAVRNSYRRRPDDVCTVAVT